MKLILGDCIEKMSEIATGSVDLILADPPYGTTACQWDSIIPFEEMWGQVWRTLKPSGACALFGAEPFSSALRSSQMKAFKNDWVWVKARPTGFLNAKKYPLKKFEVISIFCKKTPQYNPQFWESKPMNTTYTSGGGGKDGIYRGENKKRREEQNTTKRYPVNVLYFNGVNNNTKRFHPSQKPLDLLEYLIRTYTKEGDTVLDFTMGSGSTGVAAKNTGRDFIGIEKDKKYFEIAKERIEAAI